MSASLYICTPLFYPLQIVILLKQLFCGAIRIYMMSDSSELEAVRKCTSHLETALKALDRELVHFLRDEGFVTDDVHDDLLTPRTMLTEAERAGELVKWIKNRVKQDPRSFHLLLQHFRRRGALYKPIVNELSAEYLTIVASCTDFGGVQHSSPSCPLQLTHEPKLGPEKREIASDLTDSQPSLPSSPSQNTVSRRQPSETTPEPLSPSPQTSQLAIVQTPQPPETYQQVDSAGEYFSVQATHNYIHGYFGAH